MAEYIDRAEVLELKQDYGEGQYSMMLIDPVLVKKLSTADVIERSKIDKAIEELQNMKVYDRTRTARLVSLPEVFEILKRNTGE